MSAWNDATGHEIRREPKEIMDFKLAADELKAAGEKFFGDLKGLSVKLSQQAQSSALGVMAVEIRTFLDGAGIMDRGIRGVPTDISHMHAELSEMFEAWRKGWLGQDMIRRNSDSAVVETSVEPGKPIGLPAECADLFIRLLDFCDRHSIDLYAQYRRVMEYNKSTNRNWEREGKRS